MATLLDIAPQTKAVPVLGKSITVRGLSAASIAVLIARFPEIQEVFASGLAGLDAGTISRIGEEAVGATIAAATGMGGNEQVEAIARSLAVGDQFSILKAAYDLTFPKGVSDFLTTLGLAAPEGLAAAAATAS